MAVPSPNLTKMSLSVDEFEQSFQACTAILGSNSVNHTHDPEEAKASVDQTIQKFLDSAKALESIFLQKRLYLSVHRPEQSLAEEIQDLKAEIHKKDMVLQRFNEKLDQWKGILTDSGVRPPLILPSPSNQPGPMTPHARPPMVSPQMMQRVPQPGAPMRMMTSPVPQGNMMGPRMAGAMGVPGPPNAYGPPPQQPIAVRCQ